MLLSEGHEVLVSNFEGFTNAPLETRSTGDRQIAIEGDPVDAGADTDYQAGKLDEEARQRVHGVFLQVGIGCKPILSEEGSF